MKLRSIFAALCLLSLTTFLPAQSGTWTWIKGDSTTESLGSYGTLGVPASSNEPPARYACLAQWTDTAGFFWMYGGYRYSCTFADLWRFNPVTQMWTWMSGDSMQGITTFAPVMSAKGVYDPTNKPGALDAGMFAWVTADNHLWLFGRNSDFWQYNPAIDQWAWMGNFGPVNFGVQGIGNASTMPGGRIESTSAWVDSGGNLWLFGGEYSDMWKYDVPTGIWTWMSGSQTPNNTGVYGSLGIPSVNNYPSSRQNCVFWKDNAGNFWLSGGSAYQAYQMWYQDVWKFNPLTLEWTWISGPQSSDTNEIATINCDTSYLNKEGPRWENRAVWKLCDDLVLNFGGFQNLSFMLITNDMWAYKISAKEWIQIASWPATGRYGTKGVTNANNYPAARFGSIGFLDRNNGLWLFGGINYNPPTPVSFNDLWKYVPDTTCIGGLSCNRSCQTGPVMISSNIPVICANDSAQICAPAGYNSYSWNNSASSECIYAKLAGNYYVTVTDNNGCSAESNHISLAVYNPPPVSISVNGDTLRVYNSISQQWYRNGNILTGDTDKVFVVTSSGYYTVEVRDSNDCTITSNQVDLSVGIYNLEPDKVQVYPNPLSTGNWNIDVSEDLLGSRLDIFDDQGRIIFKSEIGKLHSEIVLNAAQGVYLLRISSENWGVVKKLVKL